MPIITDNLRESGLGRVIKFYTLVPEERISSKLHRQAELLVAKWTRPIMQRSANYRDRHIRRADEAAGANTNSGPAAQEMSSPSRRPSQASSGNRPVSGGFQSAAVDVFAKRPAHSRSWKGLLPQPVAPHYRVAPPNQVDEALDAHDHNKRYDKIIRGSQAKSHGRQKAG
ncbi:MAG: hypothetical protein BJ554DRAFT_7974 [Olpidium bornovanus]|uniref:TFIIS N-terminal domain-containing protein n=1 Tax=Olpidium bornovanus TaxID=278681 RepID=A0A8H8DJE8_9FUNG|nr:MAG: hypothetical protein BJ554DRAFT_7974 [Olpidium bornovanus]